MFRGAWRLVALAVLVVASAATSALATPSRPAGSVGAVSSLETGVLTDINQYRRDHGLVPLRLSAGLTASARDHSQSMASRGYFGHESADGSPFWKRVRRYHAQGSRGYWSVGENLLWSSPDVDPSAALQMWIDSPPHRENLLNPSWREIGISAVHVDSAPGTYGGDPVTIITTDFGVRR